MILKPAHNELITLNEAPLFRANQYPDLFWATPSPAGRFNVAGSGPTQYMSDHPLGPLAERVRGAERYFGAAVDESALEYIELRQRVWALKLSADYVFDLTFATASRIGLRAEDLVAEDYRATQAAGETYGRNDPEFPSIWRYSSAALPGTSNIVIFGPRWMSAYDQPSVSDVRIPGCLLAVKAAPPMELSLMMRHFGMPHKALMSYQNGSDFVLEQPTHFALHRDESN